MIPETVVELSCWQFALTATLHFLCIPLSLGLAGWLAVLESAYVVSQRPVYKTLAQTWARFFVLSTLLAIATRLLLIGQFGMLGSYFSHYAGDVFALPLAIEAMSSFFLLTLLLGPYWFGWQSLGPKTHLAITWLIVLAVNVSAYTLAVAQGWLQYPLAASFEHQAYRLELTELSLLFSNPAAWYKFLHTSASSYSTAAASLLAISSFWLHKQPQDEVARRSFTWAALMGLIAINLSVWLGDPTPNLPHPVQQAKQAALQNRSPAELLPDIEARITSGIKAYALLQDLRDDIKDPQLLADFHQHRADLGYALLLTPIHKAILDAKPQHIRQAAQSALPAHPGLLRISYWLMIGCGVLSMVWFALAVFSSLRTPDLPDWLLQASRYLAALPWLAGLSGWLLAELGKQPWTIAGLLPELLSVSSVSVWQTVITGLGYISIEACLVIMSFYLLRRWLLAHPLATSGV